MQMVNTCSAGRPAAGSSTRCRTAAALPTRQPAAIGDAASPPLRPVRTKAATKATAKVPKQGTAATANFDSPFTAWSERAGEEARLAKPGKPSCQPATLP